ncbi:hypothetical protein HDU84_007228 [Entophlyctis sp. JEL0112]|nr:hypothetical protein HDU84_007228 [Entophlyctis sp. JEL0112]
MTDSPNNDHHAPLAALVSLANQEHYAYHGITSVSYDSYGSQVSPAADTIPAPQSPHEALQTPMKIKVGRKPDPNEAATKRLQQTRAAQRRFRNRQVTKVQDMERRISELGQLLQDTQGYAESLRLRVVELEESNADLQARLIAAASGGDAAARIRNPRPDEMESAHSSKLPTSGTTQAPQHQLPQLASAPCTSAGETPRSGSVEAKSTMESPGVCFQQQQHHQQQRRMDSAGEEALQQPRILPTPLADTRFWSIV